MRGGTGKRECARRVEAPGPQEIISRVRRSDAPAEQGETRTP